MLGMEYQTFFVDPLQYPVGKLKENGGSVGNGEASDSCHYGKHTVAKKLTGRTPGDGSFSKGLQRLLCFGLHRDIVH
jgi:hypothetical protein